MLLQYPSQSEHKHVTRSVYHFMTSQLPQKKRSLHAEGPKNHNCYIKSKSQTRADQQQKSQRQITTTWIQTRSDYIQEEQREDTKSYTRSRNETMVRSNGAQPEEGEFGGSPSQISPGSLPSQELRGRGKSRRSRWKVMERASSRTRRLICSIKRNAPWPLDSPSTVHN